MDSNNPLYKIFVINLKRSTERFGTLSTTASSLNIDIQRVEGVDGAALVDKDWPDVDNALFKKRNGRLPLAGEYGCYKSHLSALQAFLDEDMPFGVIIEDDIVPNKQTAERIDAILDSFTNFDFIKLVNHRNQIFMRLLTTRMHDKIGRCLLGPQGSAAAYLVSRAGAKRLMKQLGTMSLPYDVALERTWDSGTEGYTTDKNLFDFSDHRTNSTILGRGIYSYKHLKFHWTQRLSTLGFRAKDLARRVHFSLKSPAIIDSVDSYLPSTNKQMISLWDWGFFCALLAMISVIWYESDLYRYAGFGIIMVTLVFYFRYELLNYRRMLIGWPGIICLSWVFHLLTRAGLDLAANPEIDLGGAEGIYILPLFYPTFGYALYRFLKNPFLLGRAFILISLIVLIVGTDYQFISSLSAGVDFRAVTFLHNNSIHASIGAGFMVIGAVYFALYLFAQTTLSPKLKSLSLVLSIIVIAYGLLNIINLQSKGVWLALIFSLPIIMIHLTKQLRTKIIIVVFALCTASIAITSIMIPDRSLNNVTATAESTFIFIKELADGNGLIKSLEHIIAEGNTPHSSLQRMMLWTDALTIWQERPLIGQGLNWHNEWNERTYKEADHSLLHNGYLEIAIRYGLAGLVFYAWLYVWSIKQVLSAAKANLISKEAARCHFVMSFYLALTMLSNSNIRLALGESSMWLAAGFGFYCYYLRQHAGLKKPRSFM